MPLVKNRLYRYWKLSSGNEHNVSDMKKTLADAGFVLGQGPSKALPLRKMHRIERQQIIYDKCSTKELQSFLATRGLGAREKRNVAIMALQWAAECLEFSRFLDLPPELRKRVYNFHLADLPETMRPGVQPPPTRTCTLIRAETLALFYGTRTFELRFFEHPGRSSKGFQATNDVDLFLAKTLQQNLLEMRKVNILVDYHWKSNEEDDYPINNPEVSYEIEIKSGGDDFISRVNIDSSRSQDDGKESGARTINKILMAEGRLSSEAIYKTRQALEQICGLDCDCWVDFCMADGSKLVYYESKMLR